MLDFILHNIVAKAGLKGYECTKHTASSNYVASYPSTIKAPYTSIYFILHMKNACNSACANWW